MQNEPILPINQVQSAFCGQCGCVLVEAMPWHNIGKTTAVDKYYCLNCKTCPSVVTYIYKTDR